MPPLATGPAYGFGMHEPDRQLRDLIKTPLLHCWGKHERLERLGDHFYPHLLVIYHPL